MKFIPPLLCIVFIIFTVVSRDTIFDMKQCNWQYDRYTDSKDGGNSTISKQLISNLPAIKYTIGTAIAYPYVGAGFSSPDTNHFLDLSKYSSILIDLDSSCSDMNISINQFIPGHSRIEDGSTQEQTMAELIKDSGVTRYELKLSSFATQQWWFAMNNLTTADLPAKRFGKVCGINFSNHPHNKREREKTIHVNRVAFRKDISNQIIGAILVLFGWFFIPLIYRKIQKLRLRSEEGRTFIPYEKTEMGISPKGKQASERVQVSEFMSVEYKNPKISLEYAEKTLGIPQHRIRTLVKEFSGTGFKEYLTKLRIAEAKRLLSEDSHQIQEVAKAVGYPHTSTFNHNFKSITGFTPREFRDQLQER